MAKDNKRWGFWWIVLVLLLNELALVFLFLPPQTIQEVSAREARLVAADLGEDALAYTAERSGQRFRRLLVDTGVVDASFLFVNQQGRDRFDDRGLGAWVSRRLQVFWLTVRQMFFRWEVMALWLPGLLVFLVPLWVDGMVQREIRKYQFSYASPLWHRKASLVIKALLAAAVLLPFLPVSVPPLAYPAALGLGGLSFWAMVVNMQKRI